MITWKQAQDLGIWCLARSTRFALGWYWSDSQRAELVKAEQVALEAYHQHGRGGA